MKILTSELEHSIKGTNMNAIEQLKSVLCDPTGKCCIKGSEEDRAIVDRALQALAQPDYRAIKTYHEGKPVYVAQQEQQ